MQGVKAAWENRINWIILIAVEATFVQEKHQYEKGMSVDFVGITKEWQSSKRISTPINLNKDQCCCCNR